MTSCPLVLLPITCYFIGFVRRDSFFLLGTWYCLRHFIVVLHVPFKLSNLDMEMYSTVSVKFISLAFMFKQKKDYVPRILHTSSSQNPCYFYAS